MAPVRTQLLGVKLPFWLWRWLYRDLARLIEREWPESDFDREEAA